MSGFIRVTHRNQKNSRRPPLLFPHETVFKNSHGACVSFHCGGVAGSVGSSFIYSHRLATALSEPETNGPYPADYGCGAYGGRIDLVCRREQQFRLRRSDVHRELRFSGLSDTGRCGCGAGERSALHFRQPVQTESGGIVDHPGAGVPVSAVQPFVRSRILTGTSVRSGSLNESLRLIDSVSS